MKKTNTIIFTLLLLVASFAFVAAEDEVDVPEVEKITGMNRFSERLRMAFTFNKEKKINAALEMAEKRLAYAEEIAEDNPELAAEIQEEYDDFIARAEEVLSEMETDANKEEEFENEVARIARIENRFEKHQEITDMIYARAINKFEENNASEEKIARFEMFYERAQNRSRDMEEKALGRQNAIMQRRARTLNASEEDFEEFKEKVEKREGITEEREARFKRRQKIAENISQIQEKRIERMREKLNSTNLTDGQRAAFTRQVETAQMIRNRAIENIYRVPKNEKFNWSEDRIMLDGNLSDNSSEDYSNLQEARDARRTAMDELASR